MPPYMIDRIGKVTKEESDRLEREADLLEEQLQKIRDLKNVQRQKEESVASEAAAAAPATRWRSAAEPVEDDAGALHESFSDDEPPPRPLRRPPAPVEKPALPRRKPGEWAGIEAFLEDVGLGKFGYASRFEELGLDSPEAVAMLDPAGLRKLGVEHQHAQKLRMGIAELRMFAGLAPSAGRVSAAKLPVANNNSNINKNSNNNNNNNSSNNNDSSNNSNNDSNNTLNNKNNNSSSNSNNNNSNSSNNSTKNSSHNNSNSNNNSSNNNSSSSNNNNNSNNSNNSNNNNISGAKPPIGKAEGGTGGVRAEGGDSGYSAARPAPASRAASSGPSAGRPPQPSGLPDVACSSVGAPRRAPLGDRKPPSVGDRPGVYRPRAPVVQDGARVARSASPAPVRALPPPPRAPKEVSPGQSERRQPPTQRMAK
ncbi:unnamed protein product [Polarella glacialis]|uniref:SAM domain-containing protein n=1 Tax=Polarella glacialis TaxID=89957 RepID=A0A813HKB6_POLGL|nr:unnamed protein product [Polarella glacialis]